MSRGAKLSDRISFVQDLRAALANRVFRTDEKHIRTENEVSVKANARSALCRS
jgi:hypothetical protein